MYCYGLKSEKKNFWQRIWKKWNQTSDVTYLKYITCSENTNFITSYLSMIRRNFLLFIKELPNYQGIRNNTVIDSIIDIFLHLVAKHARKDAILYCNILILIYLYIYNIFYATNKYIYNNNFL